MGMRINHDECGGVGSIEIYDGGKHYCHKCSKMVKGGGQGGLFTEKEYVPTSVLDAHWTYCGLPGGLTDYHLTKGISTYIGPARPKNGHGTVLVVPIFGKDRRLQSLQSINGKGDKRFYKDGKVKGGFCIITEHCADIRTPSTDLVFLCEGYATGLSAYQVFERDVVVAFNAGNIKNVVSYWPGKTLVILADNDKVSQTGIIKAKEACEGRDNVKVILTPEAGDFNDYVVKHGIEHTKKVYAKLLEEIL